MLGAGNNQSKVSANFSVPQEAEAVVFGVRMHISTGSGTGSRRLEAFVDTTLATAQMTAGTALPL